MAFEVRSVKSVWTGTIYIRADGRIDPLDAPMTTIDNITYTLTGEVSTNSHGIVIERDNIIVDGNYYAIYGSASPSGILVCSRINVTIINVTIMGFQDGVILYYSNSSAIKGNILANNGRGIAILTYSYNNIVEENNILNNEKGVDIDFAFNNTIRRNLISNNGNGMCVVDQSSNNVIINNSLVDNNYGLRIDYAGSNILRDNILENNQLSLGVYGQNLSQFIQDIDVSNTVNGKPVYYWVNEHDREVPANAGYVGIVNSSKIYVKNLNLRNNMQGILLAYTNYSIVEFNTILDNEVALYSFSSNYNTLNANNLANNYGVGIFLVLSKGNNVTKNTISVSDFSGINIITSNNNILTENLVTHSSLKSIVLSNAHNNTLTKNNIIANNGSGIYLYRSNQNFLEQNTIKDNDIGLEISYSDNNLFVHNHFINNTLQVAASFSYLNMWNNSYPSGGNYWSDYSGTDVKNGPNQDIPGSDGIGDMPYIINSDNQDHYPLMNPYGAPPPPMCTLTLSVTVGGITDPPPGVYSYTVNLTVHVMAISDVNYFLEYWELDGVNVGSENPCPILMDKNHTLKAVFSLIPPLSASISPYSASILVGESVTFTSKVSGGRIPHSYQWYLDDNPVLAAILEKWTFKPTTSGTYRVYLEITDARGNTTKSNIALIEVASLPVGGYSLSIQTLATAKSLALYLILTVIPIIALTAIKRKTRTKPIERENSC